MSNSGEDRTRKWYDTSIKVAKEYGGKISVMPKVPVTGLRDFSIYYTPGVAGVSLEIAKNSDLSFELTWRWNAIAVLTDGTRVLGLGNVGPEAALPVMEGKALIFKYLGGVDAVPLPIRVKSREEFVAVAKAIEPSFGGINLEDIESPKCFYLLETLRKELNIPVWHDDQQGTAGAILAGLFNALKIVDKNINDVKVVLFGAGASNIAAARILHAAGVNYGNMILIDSKGPLHAEREDMDKLMLNNPWKYDLALKTNKERSKTIEDAMKGADVLISASTPGPNVIKKDWIKAMNKDAVVFALANPVPEIWPWEAKEAGARIVATGRSDFPNQINNSLIFPSVFRGALDVRARGISDEVIVAVAREIAKYAEEKGITEDYIIPTMEEWEVYPRAAAAAAVEIVKEGLARVTTTYNEELERARSIIAKSRASMEKLMREGLIKELPAELMR
ncbi:NAD(P)-dependent malic enzyme [Caldivirga maquilingensis]|uniref:Malate dehydrogenase (Oxaloacetate-decarboxylating) n=1 Tax=Caldivirga maquilingensis (strain ATCC 700844 / DSM 13496 / JCM 10307 / IC-167) TaxID=397948 RepID=A8MBC9_CALMQ|nr:NADP-dependent malic enzyme [Caldivirga maquilingensis]ABW01219.1 Malate dehydrogenase (oxaloacetate-decarboxylating) [Caldivirga maquilingensis IC-167]